MRIALEGFVLLNLLMNGFALLMSARVASCKRIRPGKILCGAWAGTLYALLAYTWPPARTVLFFPVSLLMAACIAPQMRVRVLLRCAGILIGCTFLLGGTGYALMQALKSRGLALALGTPVALYCVFRLVRTRTERSGSMTVRLRCEYLGNSAELDGFVDSGNRLLDAVTGLPAIVVSAGDVRRVLPKSADPADISTLPPGFRLIALAGVCGAEMVMCFHPKVWVRQKDAWCEVQAVMAIAPRPLPEGALVPLSLV